jgi:tetratricopeptide (TPR) repeat protein
MTGIGKTALAEKLAADLLVNEAAGTSDRLSLPPDIKFHRISFDIGTPSTDFTRGAIAILQAIGDDTAQQLPDEQILPYLLKTLEQRPYWLQFDSLEYLLHQSDNGSYRFADAVWVEFFVQLLNSPRSQSRLVLTSQALPADLVDRIYRYDQLWHEYPLRGLEAAHWLDLFRNYGITPTTDTEGDYIGAIAHYFQGHPLILKMIAGDIRSRLFGGSITKYWTEYYNPQQSNPRQTPSILRQSQEQRSRQWVSQTIQQLPDLPRQMLQRCAVFRRPVAESFYLQMLEDASDADCAAALTTLKSRNLVEDINIQAGQLLIQQHNLVRDSAYAQLKANSFIWETAERTAAHLWLTAYTSLPNAERIETVRGYLEAFGHYCKVKDWDDAKLIAWTRLSTPTNDYLCWQLGTWNYYREQIPLYGKLLDIAQIEGNRQEEGWALCNLGNAYGSLGQYEQAIAHHQQSLTIAREIGDQQGEGRALGNLGSVYYSLGQYEQAIAHHQQSLTIAREIGNKNGEGASLGNLGSVYYSLGQYEQAIAHHQQSLTIAREIGNKNGEGIALMNWGGTQIKLEQYPDALENSLAALTIFREIGDRSNEAETLKNLAELYQKLGEADVAREYCEQALALATELGIPLKAECETLLQQIETSEGDREI